MAFDTSSLNVKNLPWRWRRVGEWMLDTGKDMSSLDSNYRTVLQIAGGTDYGTDRPPITNASLVSAAAGAVIFDVSSYDADLPLTFDVGRSAVNYPNGNAAPTTAGANITLSSGRYTDTAAAGGEQIRYVFAGTDNDAVEGPITEVFTVTLAPTAIADLAAVDADATEAGTIVNITFTEATGSVSTTLYWDATGGSVQDVIDTGTEVTGATTGMQVDALGAGNFDFVLVSTNPGGSTPVAAVVTANVQISV